MKKVKIRTLYLIAIIVGGLVGLATKSTYAMFTASAEIDNPITVYTTLDSENDIIETIEITINSNDTKEIPITINNSSTSTLNYAIWYISNDSNIKVGTNLSNTDSNSPTSTIASNITKKVYVQLKNTTSNIITITLGISSSTNNVVISNSMTLVPNKEMKSLAETITKLYTNATKTAVINNGVTYNYATSVGLMNDRKGSSSVGADAGNIRYYGTSPNNYIYFNCSDYNNQSSTTCETWRIIGVFDGKVKIMRGSQIGTYSWDNKDTSTGAETAYGKNEWTDARLMRLLNPGYETDTTGGSLYYNSRSGNCYRGQNNATVTCNFTSTGIKNDTTRNIISDTTYYLGGWNNHTIYSNQIYEYERGTTVYTGRANVYAGKIAIPYPSDYSYAADLSKCSQNLYSYNNSTCTESNWIKSIITNDGNNYGWLLTQYSNASYVAWVVKSEGNISNRNVYGTNGVTPVLFLSSDQDIWSGTGTSSSPYQLFI